MEAGMIALGVTLLGVVMLWFECRGSIVFKVALGLVGVAAVVGLVLMLLIVAGLYPGGGHWLWQM